jgi:hypothetical protein
MPVELLLFLPLIAVAAHLVEEFVWPGGFPEWYRRYHPERAGSVTTRLLVVVNVVLVVLALLPPILGATARGIAFWLVVAGIGVANAAFHIWATVTRRAYSPGVVTGTLLYVPLAIYGTWVFILMGRAPLATGIQALAWGIAYHLWSSWHHRRRATASR